MYNTLVDSSSFDCGQIGYGFTKQNYELDFYELLFGIDQNIFTLEIQSRTEWVILRKCYPSEVLNSLASDKR
jgi:hypothetical protein